MLDADALDRFLDRMTEMKSSKDVLDNQEELFELRRKTGFDETYRGLRKLTVIQTLMRIWELDRGLS